MRRSDKSIHLSKRIKTSQLFILSHDRRRVNRLLLAPIKAANQGKIEMLSEPFGPWPIDLGALTPKQRETLYAYAVRRAHQERSEAIRLSMGRVASIFSMRRLTGIAVSFAVRVGATAKRMY
ncbi:MAG: hypothetical protein ABJB10_20915 [Mesorhizobium sp.]